MTKVEVLIIGGGPAGLQAAMMLGRANRKVLLCDDGRPRNGPAKAMHYFPTRDGMSPEDFRSAFHQDLSHYPKVRIEKQQVVSLGRQGQSFEAKLRDGERIEARKILFATGVEDKLPPIEGIQNLYGRSVFHCPYCHGYEFKDQAFGVLADGDIAFHLAGIVYPISSKLTLFTNGPSHFSEDQLTALWNKGIPINEGKIMALESTGTALHTVVLEAERRIPLKALLLRPEQCSKSQLPDLLGCRKNDLGLYVIDAEGRSSEAGVFLAGDNIELRQSALSAAYTGMMSGVSINNELRMEEWI